MSDIYPLLTTVNDPALGLKWASKGKRMLRGSARIGAIALATAIALSQPVFAQAPGPMPSYQVTSAGPDGLEIRFRGMPLRGVRADDSQNALSLDFHTPVDGAVFERLPAEMPQWISMAYATFDNGVIRSPRPVTFLTRTEGDGFSLRIVARNPNPGPPPVAQNYPPPPQMRGGEYAQQQVYPPPQQPYVPPQAAYRPFHTYAEYASLRSYEAQELAVRRGDPVWQMAYARAAMQSASGIGTNSEFNWYNGGDFVISTNVDGKFSFVDGIAVVGKVTYTNLEGRNVRLSDGTIAARLNQDLLSGQGGLALELGRDSELRLEAVHGNDITGAKVSLYSGGPNGFGYVKLDWQNPYLDTPASVAWGATIDKAALGYSQVLGYGLWGSLNGNYTRYGVLGDEDIARTAGWDGNLRWNMDVWNGLMAGISYDGHADYRIGFDTRIGAAPTPYVPLGIRNIENHAVTATLSSSMLGGGLWFTAYGGYINDRYSNDGLLAGLELHYMPAPGVDLALGVRHSNVSWVQGQTGKQTTAGLNLTLGMGAPPQPSWLSNQL
jgi:hypothetical protein